MPSYTIETNEGVNIDGVVKPEMLRAHLALLARFKSLEQKDKNVDDRYLLRAQQRYLLWLQLLRKKQFMDEEIPIPPIDVCIIWHAHLLSPLRYYEDMMRIYARDSKEYTFPLARMHEIWIQNGKHSDARSQFIWENFTNQPWDLDPLEDSDFIMPCPWCQTKNNIPSLDYVKLMRSQDHSIPCQNCSIELSNETLSAYRFLKDIEVWKGEKTIPLGGSIIDSATGDYNELMAAWQLNLLFDNFTRILWPGENRYKWFHIKKQINDEMNNLKEQNQLTRDRKEIMQRILFAYAGIPFAFSINLINAVIRQREFTNKMVNNDWINSLATQAQAVVRYDKFLLLQKSRGGKIFVPTLDIDLSWHTHMLHAPVYRKFTQYHFNRIINHDDTIAESLLSNYFGQTTIAWFKKYNESYTHEDPSKYWFTKSIKVRVAIFPPYGLYVLYRLKKFKRNTRNIEHICGEEANKAERKSWVFVAPMSTNLCSENVCASCGVNYGGGGGCGGCGGGCGGCGGGGCGGGSC